MKNALRAVGEGFMPSRDQVPATTGARNTAHPVRAGINPAPSVSKKSFRHAVRIFKLSKKFKNTCRLNAKGAFCPLHTSPAALSQTSSVRFFDSLRAGINPAPTTESAAAYYKRSFTMNEIFLLKL